MLDDSNARWTLQLRPRRVRLCCLLRRLDPGVVKAETVGEVYLDKVDSLSTPEIDEGDPREAAGFKQRRPKGFTPQVDWLKDPGDRWIHVG